MKKITLPLVEYEDMLATFACVEKQRDYLIGLVSMGHVGDMAHGVARRFILALADSVRPQYSLNSIQLAEFLRFQAESGKIGKAFFEELTSGRIPVPEPRTAKRRKRK